MTLLSDRIQKANKLNFRDIPGTKTSTGATMGSQGDHYQMSLYQSKEWELVVIDEETIKVVVIKTCCQKIDVGNGKLDQMTDCQGNCRHTICYHSLGFLKHKLAQRGKTISFYSGILDALNGLNFGGQLTKVISKQGQGFVWAIVREKPVKSEIKNLDNKATRLMRDDEEGID